MVDNDIIKALECCLVEPKTIFLRDNKTGEITTLNMNDIFNLITHLQARVEKAEKVEYFADKTIATLQAENERLEVENQSLRGAANSLKMHYEKAQAEIERLTADVKTLENIIKNSFLEKAGLNIDPLTEIKSEAVKEFAEQIFELFPADKSVTYISKVTIKHILKEMVGENNADM